MEKKIKSKIEIKLTEGERDLLYFYLLGVYSLEDIETFEEYPAVVDKLEESITEVAKSTRRRRGVESKMEKIELVNHDLIVDFDRIESKINEIIDYLNSQDQEEEKKTATESQIEVETEINKRKNLLIDVVRELEKGINSIAFEHKGEKMFVGKLLRDLGYDNFYNILPKRLQIITTEELKSIPKYTPEQKEEWEERFAEFFLYVTNDKNWVDGRPEWKGDVFVTLYNAILHFIEKLLDEKEREAYEKGKEYQANLDRACYGTSFEKLEKGIVDDKDPLAPKKGIDWSSPKEVSKLTTK